MNRERPQIPALRRAGVAPGSLLGTQESGSQMVVIQAPSTDDLTTVLDGVKGALAALGGSAALDAACAPWGTCRCRRRQEKGCSRGWEDSRGPVPSALASRVFTRC